jgi:hypothetical protein
MKKKFIFGDLSSVEKRAKRLNSCQIVAFRQGDKVHLSNFEADEGRVQIGFDKARDELVFRFKLKENDYVAFGEENGIAGKRQIESDPSL